MDLSEIVYGAFRAMKENKMPETGQVFRGLVSDLCGDDYEGRDGAERLVSLDRRIELFSMIAKGETDAAIEAKYPLVADLVTREEYLFDTALLRRAARGESLSSARPKALTTVVSRKKSGSASSASAQTVTSTQVPAVKKSMKMNSFRLERIWWVIAAVAIAGFLSLWLLIPLPALGQHIVGGFGGVGVFVTALLLTRHFEKGRWLLFGVLLILTALLSTIYGLVFPDRSRIIAFWVVGCAIFFSVIYMYLAFSAKAVGEGPFAFTEGVIAVIFEIFLGVFREMTLVAWQNLIGVVGGMALVAALWGICRLLNRDRAFLPHHYLVVPLLVANVVLCFVFQEAYFVIAVWLSVFFTGSCILATVLTARAHLYDSHIEEDLWIVPFLEGWVPFLTFLIVGGILLWG